MTEVRPCRWCNQHAPQHDYDCAVGLAIKAERERCISFVREYVKQHEDTFARRVLHGVADALDRGDVTEVRPFADAVRYLFEIICGVAWFTGGFLTAVAIMTWH